MLPLSPAHILWALAALAPAALLLTCARLRKKKPVEAASPGPGGSLVSPNGTPTGGSARTVTGSNSATSVRPHYEPTPAVQEQPPPLGYREGIINRILEDKYYKKKREPSVSSLQFERSSRPRHKQAPKGSLKDGCYRNSRGETVRPANDDETLNMVDSGCFGAQQAVVSRKEVPDGKSAPAPPSGQIPSSVLDKKDSTRKEPEQKESARSDRKKKKKSRDGRRKNSRDSRKKGRKRRSRHRSESTTETTEESEEDESEPTRRRRKRSDRKRRKDSPVEKKKEKVKNEKKEEKKEQPKSPSQPEPNPDPAGRAPDPDPEQHKTAPTQKSECD